MNTYSLRYGYKFNPIKAQINSTKQKNKAIGATEGRTCAIVPKSLTADLKITIILHDLMTYMKLMRAATS